MDSKLASKSSSSKEFGSDFADNPIPNLRSGRGVNVHLRFLRLSRSGWRWVHHRGIALFFFRRRIRHGRFFLLTSREQRHAGEQTNISSHVSGSNLRTNLVVFEESARYHGFHRSSGRAPTFVIFFRSRIPLILSNSCSETILHLKARDSAIPFYRI